jgi:hypothetical protein
VTGAAVSAGFIHSCLARAAAAVAGPVAVIRDLIRAAPVAGFGKTTLRAGPAGTRRYVLGAFTERHSAFFLGARTLESFRDFAILPDFAGIVVLDRYVNYFHDGWEHIVGHQACCAHYPDTVVMPIPGGPVLAAGGDRVRGVGIIRGLRGRPAADRAGGSGRAGLLAGWCGRGLAA